MSSLYESPSQLPLASAVAGLAWCLRPAPAQLVGTVIEDRRPAPDFTLTDQLGRRQQLSRFQGRPAALTFVYSRSR